MARASLRDRSRGTSLTGMEEAENAGYESGRPTQGWLAHLATQCVGRKPNQLLHGCLQRDGDQHCAAVSGQCTGGEDECRGPDRGHCRGHGQSAQSLLWLAVGCAGTAQVAGCGRVRAVLVGQALLLRGQYLGNGAGRAMGRQGGQGDPHRTPRCAAGRQHRGESARASFLASIERPTPPALC
jgi:hypothetical protein